MMNKKECDFLDHYFSKIIFENIKIEMDHNPELKLTN